MKKLFNNTAFRIAGLFKRINLSFDCLAQGYFLLFFSITVYVFTIVHTIMSHLDTKLPKAIIILISIPLIIEIARFEELFPHAQLEFDKFEKEKTHEKHKLFKEISIMLFIFISLVSCMVVLLK